MTLDQLLTYALTKPGTEETLPFGPEALVLKVAGKMWLLIALDSKPLQLNAKCDPERATELRARYPAHILPGYHMSKKHWNTLILDGTLPNSLVTELLDHSYQLVVASLTRAQRAQLP